MSSALIRRLGIGRSRNMSIFATIDKKAICKDPTDSKVTRSIGDDDLKPAVTAEPEIIETILFVDDEYLGAYWKELPFHHSIVIIQEVIKRVIRLRGVCLEYVFVNQPMRLLWWFRIWQVVKAM